MQFDDPELQGVYERNLHALDYEDAGLRELHSVFGVYDRFRLTEHEGSPRIAAVVEALLSPEMRPALRRWYARYGEHMNPAAIEFRDRLSKLTGEKFG